MLKKIDFKSVKDAIEFLKKKGHNVKLGNPDNGIDLILEDGRIVKIIPSSSDIDLFKFLLFIKSYEKIFDLEESNIEKFYREKVIFLFTEKIEENTRILLNKFFNIVSIYD